jgi:hypothetical protein
LCFQDYNVACQAKGFGGQRIIAWAGNDAAPPCTVSGLKNFTSHMPVFLPLAVSTGNDYTEVTEKYLYLENGDEAQI